MVQVGEYNFELRCPCGVEQRADELRTLAHADATLCECTHCGALLVGIAVDDREPIPGTMETPSPVDDAGNRKVRLRLRLGGRNNAARPTARDGDGEGVLEIPARPRFFSARGCA